MSKDAVKILMDKAEEINNLAMQKYTTLVEKAEKEKSSSEQESSNLIKSAQSICGHPGEYEDGYYDHHKGEIIEKWYCKECRKFLRSF